MYLPKFRTPKDYIQRGMWLALIRILVIVVLYRNESLQGAVKPAAESSLATNAETIRICDKPNHIHIDLLSYNHPLSFIGNINWCQLYSSGLSCRKTDLVNPIGAVLPLHGQSITDENVIMDALDYSGRIANICHLKVTLELITSVRTHQIFHRSEGVQSLQLRADDIPHNQLWSMGQKNRLSSGLSSFAGFPRLPANYKCRDKARYDQQACIPYQFPLYVYVLIGWGCLVVAICGLCIPGRGSRTFYRGIIVASTACGLLTDLGACACANSATFWRFRWLLGEEDECQENQVFHGLNTVSAKPN